MSDHDRAMSRAAERMGTGLLRIADALDERNRIERERLDALLGRGSFAPTNPWSQRAASPGEES